MMWYLISLFGFLSFPIAFTAIVEGPKNSVFPEGTNVTLTCLANMENTIVWEDIIENTVIFIRKRKNTMKEKFGNFFISDAEGNYSLTIVHAQVSDDGFYSCEEGDERRNANLTVEAGPHLSIFVNNSEPVSGKRRTVSENEEASIRCRAVGAKPAVHLQLKFGDNDWVTTSDAITNDGLLFTTEIMVIRRFVRNDTTITCQATGQVSIPPTASTIPMDILHKPTCLIKLEEDMAECKCNSNPPVSSHKWYINGELKSTDHFLSVRDYVPANVTCSAVNAIGTAPLTSRYVLLKDIQSETPDTSYIVVIVIAAVVLLVIVVAVVFLFIVCKRSRQHISAYNTDNESASDAGENFVDACSTFLQPEHAVENLPLETNSKKANKDDEGTPEDFSNERNPLLSVDTPEDKRNETIKDPIQHVEDEEHSDAEEEYHDAEGEQQNDLKANSADVTHNDDGTDVDKSLRESSLARRDAEKEDTTKADEGTDVDKSFRESSLAQRCDKNEEAKEDTGAEHGGSTGGVREDEESP